MKNNFIIEDKEYNNNKFKVLYLQIEDKKYYIGTLKEYNDFYWIQTKSKKIRLDNTK